MAKKNAAAVALGKLRAKKGMPLAEVGRLGGLARGARRSVEELAEMGKKGGPKGGKARAAKLTPARRKEIAQKAAAARWGKKAEASSEPSETR